MRKAVILLAVMLVLSAAIVCTAAVGVEAVRDKVTITEDHYNDKSIVEGLQVKTRMTLDRYLLWETTYDIDEESKISTEYEFHRERYNPEFERKYDGFTVNASVEYGSDFDRDAEEQYGLSKAYKELYDETEPGEEKTRIVYLKDYYEFYPLGAQLDFPQYNCGWYGHRFDYDEMMPSKQMEEYIYMRLEEYFRIPVLENEVTEISISRSARGDAIGIGSGSKDSEMFHMFSNSVLTDTDCYFVFDAHTSEDNIVDLSYLPEGYGIFRVPYTSEPRNAESIKIDELSMVYELDPQHEILDITVSPDDSKLLLHTLEDGKYVMTVIDIDTMTMAQRLELNDWDRDNTGWQLYEGDDFLVMYVQYHELTLVSIDEDGNFNVEFITEIGEDKNLYIDYITRNMSMDFDGEKLAMAKFINGVDEDSCTFFIYVLDKTGQTYYGQYRSSLNTGRNSNYDYHVRPCDDDPIEIRWVK